MSPLSSNANNGFAPSPGQTQNVFRTDNQPKGPDHATGQDIGLGTFLTTAYGPPWTAINGTGVTSDGTDLRPNKKVYGVAVDPKQIPLGTFLHIWPNPFGHTGTFKAFDTGGAIKGKRIDFYDWRGRTTQLAWGRKNATVRKASSPSSVVVPDKTGAISLPSIPNPLSAVDDVAKAAKEFIGFLLSPKSLGGLLAKVAVMFLRTFFRALWDYLLAPFFHWQQRAVLKYDKDTLRDKSGYGGFVTMSFWATGYAILWARVGKDAALTTEPQHTPLGSIVRGLGNTRARRALVKPKDVKKKTPQKPEPVSSRARIIKQGTMMAKRRRAVHIGGMDNAELSSGPDAGRSDAAAAETESSGTA